MNQYVNKTGDFFIISLFGEKLTNHASLSLILCIMKPVLYHLMTIVCLYVYVHIHICACAYIITNLDCICWIIHRTIQYEWSTMVQLRPSSGLGITEAALGSSAVCAPNTAIKNCDQKSLYFPILCFDLFVTCVPCNTYSNQVIGVCSPASCWREERW